MSTVTAHRPVLVTGGGGFLGRAIVARLRARGQRVRILGRSDHADLRADPGVDLVRGDLADETAVFRAVGGCAAIFHVAAKAGIGGRAREYWTANLDGTRHLLAAAKAHGVREFVHTSTPSVVFDGCDHRGVDESLPIAQDIPSPYAASKAAAEKLVRGAHDPAGLRTVALRPHLIWGVGDPHLVPRLVARARAGRLRIVGRGRNVVDLTHVDHAADAHLLAWDALRAGRAGGRAYFVSDGSPVVLWEWINRLLSDLGIPPVRRRVPHDVAWTAGAIAEVLWWAFRRTDDPPMTRFVAGQLATDHWFDLAAARRDLGYAPASDLEPRRRAMVEWLRGRG